MLRAAAAAALLAAPLAASAMADALDDGIAAARCRTLETMEERMACYFWVAQVVEAELRWEEERARDMPADAPARPEE